MSGRRSGTAAARREPAPAPRYTSKIIKATALVSDTHLMLAHWDLARSTPENLERLRAENVFGKASRSRVTDMLAAFRQRYLGDAALTAALVTLARGGWSSRELRPILYYLSAKADPLLWDAALVVRDRYERHSATFTPEELRRWLEERIRVVGTAGAWSEATLIRVVRGILATLRDFGALAGQVQKHPRQPDLPVNSFAFIAFLLNAGQRSGLKLLHDPAWQLFFLPASAVERYCIEAQQLRRLSYQAAGDIIRLDFPARTVEDYARSLIDRPL